MMEKELASFSVQVSLIPHLLPGALAVLLDPPQGLSSLKQPLETGAWHNLVSNILEAKCRW